MTKILIIGGGLSGKLTALYLSQHLPDVKLILIDPEKKSLPVVGESTVEVTAQFLNSLKLGEYLEEKHLHKYGLTYYFKLPKNSQNIIDYVVHEAPGIIRLPSYNLNRYTFDAELSKRVKPKVHFISGKVIDVSFLNGMCDVDIKTSDGKEEKIEVDFVIDCSGRSRVLSKQLKLNKKSPYQRSSYWFRLTGFDKDVLTNIKVSKPLHLCFNSYYVTHHFYGYGYWIWIIPMKNENDENMISFGITYRPELVGDLKINFEDLCEILERDHPELKKLIMTGSRIEESRYYNYMYESEQYYDKNGCWFLIGDSGFTFDPANSAGIAYISHQIPQVTSIIKKKLTKTLSSSYVESMEKHINAQLALQDQWSNWYEFMNNPIKMAWTLLLANMGYFHLVVPNYMSGAYLNAGVALQVSKLIPRFAPERQPLVYPFPKLLNILASSVNDQEIIRRIPALYEKTIPFSFYRPSDISRHKLISRYFLKRAKLRMNMIILIGVYNSPKIWLLIINQILCVGLDILFFILIRMFPWIYNRHYKQNVNDKSGFEPSYSFLFSKKNHE